MIVPACIRATEFRIARNRTLRFKPTGALEPIPQGELAAHAAKRLGSGGYAARIFVGLNVGSETKWTAKQVANAVVAIRKAQKQDASASLMLQTGIYQDSEGGLVVEPSVQIVILDLAGTPKRLFVKHMKEVSEKLREQFEQEIVILEIQKSGVVKDVYSITAG